MGKNDLGNAHLLYHLPQERRDFWVTGRFLKALFSEQNSACCSLQECTYGTLEKGVEISAASSMHKAVKCWSKRPVATLWREKDSLGGGAENKFLVMRQTSWEIYSSLS